MYFNEKVLWRLLLIACMAALLGGCVAERKILKTEPARSVDPVSGTYSLFMYGCKYPRDIKNIAILDKEGDATTITVDSPDSDYVMMKGIEAHDALKDAERFVSCSFFFQKSGLNAILGPEGNIIGYEIRPLYSIRDFGVEDVLDIEYRDSGGIVRVEVDLKPGVEEATDESGPYQFRRSIPGP